MGRKPKVIKPEKVERPKLNSKEELMEYIENAPDELPFVEEVWEKAVAKAKENESLPLPRKTIKTTDEFGNEEIKSVSNGVRTTDPIGIYWSYMNLPQYKKKAIALQEKEELSTSAQDIVNTYFEDDDESMQYNEITAWINMFPIVEERNYLKQRYAHYYDNYEINDGADRAMLNGILSLEIELQRINIRRARGQSVDVAREEKLRKMLRESLEAQKWTKKQRSAMDEAASNKFTVWLDKMAKDGKFIPEVVETPKDDIDMLLEIIPQAVRKMFD